MTAANDRIVVADDDADIRQLMAFTLGRAGFGVEAVDNGAAALALIRADAPALAGLDVQMPHMTGLEVVAALTADAALRHVPVLLVSASAEQAEIRRGLDSGARGYLVKPFTPRSLIDTVRAILAATP